MAIISEKFSIHTQGNNDIIDITKYVRNAVYKHNLSEAAVYVYAPGSTVGITNIEFEPGLLVDMPEILERIVPSDVSYHHDETWHDGNGHSHLRASVIGNNTMVPLFDGVLQLGQWQQIVLVDFDTKARSRNVWVQIIY